MTEEKNISIGELFTNMQKRFADMQKQALEDLLSSCTETREMTRDEAQRIIATISTKDKIGSLLDYMEELKILKDGACFREDWFLKADQMPAEQQKLIVLAIFQRDMEDRPDDSKVRGGGLQISVSQQIAALEKNEDIPNVGEEGKVANIILSMMQVVRLQQGLAERGKIKITDPVLSE